MAFEISSETANLVVTLTEAKNHLRVEVADDDTLITSLIHAARQKSENYTNLALVPKTVNEYFDCFPSVSGQTPQSEFRLMVTPLESLTSIEYNASSDNDVLTTIVATNYVMDKVTKFARIAPKGSYSWPSTDGRLNGIKIIYAAGYQDVADVPQAIKQAMLLMIGDWYERREDRNKQGQASSFIIPSHAELLLKPYRVFEWI